jgi:hypothetical protein
VIVLKGSVNAKLHLGADPPIAKSVEPPLERGSSLKPDEEGTPHLLIAVVDAGSADLPRGFAGPNP